ncbi:hypothetical protein [Ferrimonas balearica]|uniref:hypothetical protein n=1 Tax=Ferrimonas balearica TaxID=44012 RepID=UPI001F3D499E|nr:hypothetical protein [Ferrimonas balearica]MBY6096165.1 hypothetical protein [Ferrimonas balearica]
MTIKAKKHPLDNFFQRLGALDPKLAKPAGKRQLLPEWWDPSLKSSSSAVQQAIVGMSRLLNLDLASVLDPTQELRQKEVMCQYKRSKRAANDDLAVATSMVHGIAQTAIRAIEKDYTPLPNAAELRAQILSGTDKWVSFEALVEICWMHGIPVLYIPVLPVSKKMDAVVVDIDGRPAIALTSKKAHASWLVFHLAHEMGHIAEGHLEPGETLVDETISEQEEGADDNERAADKYALELITGDAERQYYSTRRMDGQTLAAQASTIGLEHNVDPGHIVLNWAHGMANSVTSRVAWATAQSALKTLYPNADWIALLHRKMEEALDESRVGESEFDYLYKLTGLED